MTNLAPARFARRTAAALVLAAAVPAAAQPLPFGASVAPAYASYSKTDAILGGAPSALAAILSQQAVKPAAIFAAAPSPNSPGSYFRNAIYSLPRGPVATDRPDIFGTVALSVSHTSLDRRWNKVSHSPVGNHAASYAVGVASLSPLARLDAVNRYVNQHVTFVNDIQQHGVSDLWSPAADTLRRGRGDCEDFAIAKLQMLRRAGFADKDLYLVILRDVARRADHAVLVARADGRLLVLDNGTNRIVDSATISDYRPILTFSGNHAWTHGYRREMPTMQLASADRPAMVEMASGSVPIEPASLSN
jgi:predicted transglutaminase-like cysteine proteinase